MAISDNDSKLLWGRAAGVCSNPDCRADLTVMLEGGGHFNVGEMAHVIARKPRGPRGVPTGGADSYDNLILLCPTCHRKVDKSKEGAYPAELLKSWKRDHEQAIRNDGQQRTFATIVALKAFVSSLLMENGVIWQEIGPQSKSAQSDPGSNLHEVWKLRKLDTVVPNNRRIINALETNKVLLNAAELASFIRFKLHATAFEHHQYNRIDSYPLFPADFAELFRQ